MFIEPDTHRKFSRIKFDRQVDLEFVSDKYDDCKIKDLSLTGMFAQGPFQKQMGKHCIVNLVQKGKATDLSLQASAKVVRENDEGIAIEFISMPFDSYMFLQATLLCEAVDGFKRKKEFPEHYPYEITERLLLPVDENCTFL